MAWKNQLIHTIIGNMFMRRLNTDMWGFVIIRMFNVNTELLIMSIKMKFKGRISKKCWGTALSHLSHFAIPPYLTHLGPPFSKIRYYSKIVWTFCKYKNKTFQQNWYKDIRLTPIRGGDKFFSFDHNFWRFQSNIGMLSKKEIIT